MIMKKVETETKYYCDMCKEEYCVYDFPIIDNIKVKLDFPCVGVSKDICKKCFKKMIEIIIRDTVE